MKTEKGNGVAEKFIWQSVHLIRPGNEKQPEELKATLKNQKWLTWFCKTFLSSFESFTAPNVQDKSSFLVV